MRVTHLTACLCVLLATALADKASSSSSSSAPEWPIKHVVVLMFENRAFDHMLGYLMESQPQIEGLNGTECLPRNVSVPEDGDICVTDDQVFISWSPGHSIPDTTWQVFGTPNEPEVLPEVAPMNGFVEDAAVLNMVASADGAQPMTMFNKSMVPVISTLAEQFGVFNRWHASIPGPTEVNRLYVNTATSYGAGDNDLEMLAEGYPQTTIFDQLNDADMDWACVYSDFPTTLFLRHQRELENLERYHTLDEFFTMVHEGELPTYTFVEPRYFAVPFFPASDQHPSHSVAEGEMVMKKVYEALRAAPTWNDTLFLITYDEHGGFYDHVPTPLRGVPNPDGRVSLEPPFNFTRLGVRVPCIAISPWINAGSAYGEPSGPTNTSHYEHSSVPATLKKMFGLDGFLTKRDEWAGTFESIVMDRTEPRTDCPTLLPDPPIETFEKFRQYREPISDLQEAIIATAANVGGVKVSKHEVATEELGGKFVAEIAERVIKGARTKSE